MPRSVTRVARLAGYCLLGCFQIHRTFRRSNPLAKDIFQIAIEITQTEQRDAYQQMLSIFDSLRVEDEEFRVLFAEQLRQAANWEFAQANQEDGILKKRHTEVVRLQQQLLNLRLLEEIDASTFAAKSRELRDEEAELRLEMERCSRGRHEIIDIAIKAFELSQTPRQQWFTADYAAKRRILEILCLNCTLDGVSLCISMRKPFDLLAKGLDFEKSRGDKTPLELFRHGVEELQTSQPNICSHVAAVLA